MALTLADRQKAEVKAATDLAELVREYGVKLRQQGDNWIGLCLFHEEDTESFYVYPDHYHCYGCGEHGDVFSFVQATQNVSFKDALMCLSKRAGIKLSGAVRPAPATERKVEPHGKKPLKTNKECVLTPPETTATAQPFGCTLDAYAEARRLPVEFLTGLGLADSTYPRGSGNLAVRIPYRDETGQERATQFRVALQRPESGPSYLCPKGTKTLLYGLWRRELDAKSIIIVEGPFDCHSPTVTPSGTTVTTP